jgi:hypothetical protein
MCAWGARSPDAPQVPWEGILGMQFLLNASTMLTTMSGEIAENAVDKELILISNIILPIYRGMISPHPTECDRMRFNWSLASSYLSILTLLKDPIPVVTPYIVLPVSIDF